MLDRYFDILAGKRRPRFHQTRLLPAPVSGEVAAGCPDLLAYKAAKAASLLSSCCFCERCCGADRAAGELGYCGVPAASRYASEFLHYGEEPELVPSHTIFFTGCNFSCVYCQNWDIATRPLGGALADPRELAAIIDRRRGLGSRNVNFVGGNPDPHLHTCLETVSLLKSDVPVVWNSNSYASETTMKLLDGVIDVFLSDIRYGDDGCARSYSDVPHYWRTVTRNLMQAESQAEVMVRHLVLPGHLECCTRPIMAWFSEHMPGAYFNLMFQYHPCHHTRQYPELDRPLTATETRRALSLAREFGIRPAG